MIFIYNFLFCFIGSQDIHVPITSHLPDVNEPDSNLPLDLRINLKRASDVCPRTSSDLAMSISDRWPMNNGTGRPRSLARSFSMPLGTPECYSRCIEPTHDIIELEHTKSFARSASYMQNYIPADIDAFDQFGNDGAYAYFENGELGQTGTHFESLHKIHVCHYCSKHFNSAVNLQRHKVIHTGEKPFSCEFCDRKFTHQSNKRIHMAIHTGDRPYSCYYCTKTYAAKNQLKDHLVKHTGQKSYKCVLCDVAFAHRFSLRQHLLLKHPHGQIDPLNNDDYRPFTCEICFKKFTQLSSLKTHRRLHSGLKPYCCPVCWKCFPRKDTLTRHQYRHATERPFKCDRCEKSFATRYMLKQHSAGHVFEKKSEQYTCKVCGLDLISRQKLTHHMDIHEGKEEQVVEPT